MSLGNLPDDEIKAIQSATGNTGFTENTPSEPLAQYTPEDYAAGFSPSTIATPWGIVDHESIRQEDDTTISFDMPLPEAE